MTVGGPSGGSGLDAGAVARALQRLHDSRAAGKPLTVDEAIDLPPNHQDFLVTRATVMNSLSDRETLPPRAGLPPAVAFDAQVTAAGPVRHIDHGAAETLAPGTRAPADAGETVPPRGFATAGFGASAGPINPEDTVLRNSGGGPLPQIEGYDVVACLGRGGMGVVYDGFQQATGRRVAIKFLLDAGLASDAARQRFEREVEVVAALQHPGIVSIVDSGVRRGRYFYVMEYVEGTPLDKAMPGRDADPRASLTLLREVCEAVDYAHQRGVLHRDLKPSNILVDKQGRPHLLDFGLATRIDNAESDEGRRITIAEPGELLGTVAYMSPEQSLGQSEQTSVRSDVYSLGVIGYELLTGSLPIEPKGSLRDVLTRIAEQEPPPPSAMRPELSRDVDAVLLKALEKLPEKRYPTAGELAADIRRYLAHEPVSARRVSVAGRAWRWVRRNRTLAATIAIAAGVLVSTSTFLVFRIIEARDRAIANERVATENFAILRGVLESARTAQGGDPGVRGLLAGATARLDKTPPENPLAEATVRELIGSVQSTLGDHANAVLNFERALAVRDPGGIGADSPTLAETLHNYAAALWWEGRYAQAEPIYERALAMRRRLFEGDHKDVAMSLQHLAACRLRLAKHRSAQELYGESLEMRRRLFGEKDESVAQSLNALARSYLEAGDHLKAEPLFRRAVGTIIALRGEQYAGTAATLQNLALCLLQTERPAEARAEFQRAFDIRSKLFPSGHHLLASTLVGLAQSELALGNTSRAIELGRDAVAMYAKVGYGDRLDSADALIALGDAQRTGGDPAGGLESLLKAEAIIEKSQAVDSTTATPDTEQRCRLDLVAGECLSALGRHGDAIERLTRAYGPLSARASAGDAPVGRLASRAAISLASSYEAIGNKELAEKFRMLAVSAPSSPQSQ